MDLCPILPIYIGTAHYSEPIQELEYIRSLDAVYNVENKVSVDKRVLNYNYSFKSFIEQNLQEYFIQAMGSEQSVNPIITQSWFTYTDQMQSMHNHKHPNSIISGVFYIDAHDDELTFSEDTQTYKMLDWGYQTKQHSIKVNTGDLLLFPSSLEHHFKPIENNGRISLAFNSFLQGYFGSENGATKLGIKIF